jgi:hypothetical protein
MSLKSWYVNGTYLGPFKGLTQDKIDNLKYVGEFAGVKCFTSTDIPKGTIELWDGIYKIGQIDNFK